ncbi:P-loop containing nucleoside triphosphate hydrolase protein [Epithele typhae]|uniref:P-loop containing nucleoside triphosphate hydrolase protein n=1 Tax=Epithele typhae TaxID=378194 RepID=UPI00200791AE|nr:P-loop containing nucleoside triphosphate hydrolase protein [Epithele typhae]KAH9915236.1 P-loop containing nucleoside triphosphate hydrolase protein [Epithele typhae]
MIIDHRRFPYPRTNFTKEEPPASRERPQKGERSEQAKPPKALYIPPVEIPSYFARSVRTRFTHVFKTCCTRLAEFGVEEPSTVLDVYAQELSEGNVFRVLGYEEDRLKRMSLDLHENSRDAYEKYLCQMLYEWASHPEGAKALAPHVSPAVLQQMQTLFHAADRSLLEWDYTAARYVGPRRFIMHVGPTNSGKTHHALRALAASKRGLYAGPLRLLAYEIFDRLNKGQIVPAGIDAADAEPDADSHVADADDAQRDVVVTKKGNPRWARECNMITGEEMRIVSADAQLLSCTVEMVPISSRWQVAVVDEIQLIADPQRGGAWVTAVLGLNAEEIHLCGEESAVPLVEAMIKDLGTHWRSRGSGDFSQITKGDCVVTFSRSGLFHVKEQIEQKVKGVRCALAYGRLPPELRTEQAALFNDPNNNYDVLAGSDAIGMGLNLKIKRVIFEAVEKFNGKSFTPLSTSQIKQIAGRAGRFGLHDENPAGVVTTLKQEDLPALREAVAAAFQPLPHGYVTMTKGTFNAIVSALPVGSSNLTVAMVHKYVSKQSPLYDFQSLQDITHTLKALDDLNIKLPVPDRVTLSNAPVPWRDPKCAAAVKKLLQIFSRKSYVTVEEVLERAQLLKPLNDTLRSLSSLETIHKLLVVYLWLTFRYTIQFPDRNKAYNLQHTTEAAMDWCLEMMHLLRKGQGIPQSRKPGQRFGVADL